MRKQACLLGLTLFTLLASPGPVAAQQDSSTIRTPRYSYKLIDLGTFGGPISYQSANFEGSRILNNAGVVSSYADTTAPDPFAPDFCFDADCWWRTRIDGTTAFYRTWGCSQPAIAVWLLR
jgi:hypothetical protein